MKLNLAKCAFFIKSGKFLSYMVNARGIEPNLEKVKTILKIPKPSCIRNVQKLTWRVITLNWFMSKSTEKCLPFFKKLRKCPNFEWTEKCQWAFAELKSYLSSPKVLSQPIGQEGFYICLGASDQAVSAVLVRKSRGPKANLLYEQSFEGSRNLVPQYRKSYVGPTSGH